jgi:hypothetical protein
VAIAAVAIAIAAPGVWSSAASAQQTQEPALTVIEAVRAEPASIVRLQIQVGPSGVVSKNSFIRIRGLPPAAALSEGYSIAAGTWAVPLVALPTLSVILPAGLKGESVLAVTLVSVDGDVLAEKKMVLAITPPPEPASLRQALPERIGVAPPQASGERERALGLHAKGIEQLERGNVVAARKFFEHAAEAGLARSALALAGTFDPAELATMKIIGLQPNVEEARKWYDKARQLGAFEAAERLQRLGAR